MKQLSLVIVILFSVMIAKAQSQIIDSTNAATNLKTVAQNMMRLFIEKNYTEYVQYVHPKVLEMTGGQDKMIAGLKKFLQETEDNGYFLHKVTIGEPSEIIYTDTDMESVVPEIMELKTKDRRIVSTAYLLAISQDKGKTWQFIDITGKTSEQIQVVYPSLSNKLMVPKKTPPVFYKD